jgi:hypothetical protein
MLNKQTSTKSTELGQISEACKIWETKAIRSGLIVDTIHSDITLSNLFIWKQINT